MKTAFPPRAPRLLLSMLALTATLAPAITSSARTPDVVPPTTPMSTAGALVIAQPSLGLPTLNATGMSDLVVHIEWSRNEDATVTLQNPYNTAMKPYLETVVHVDRSATLVLPVDPAHEYASDVAIVVHDHGGHEVGRGRVGSGTRDTPVVVTMLEGEEGTLTSLVSQARIDHHTTYGSSELKSITVTSPPTMDGKLRAPEHVYGYHEATVVLASDTAIAGLNDTARAALVSWVKLGGRLVLLDKHVAALPDLPHATSSGKRAALLGAGRIVTIAPNESVAALESVTSEVRDALDTPRNGVLNTPGRSYEMDTMRRALDPNEHFRPALGAAALLILLYSVVVGPYLYRRARKRGKPLEVLITVPATAAVAFAMILGIGLFSKGIHGRSRRLTFVELGQGENTGPSRVYRAFYSTRATTVDIEPATPLSLPRLALSSGGRATGETLVLSGQKSSLRDVTLPPWQAVMTTDEAITSIDGGVYLLADSVKNDSSHPLRDAIVRTADGRCTYFDTIPAHSSAAFTSGRLAGHSCTNGSFYAWEVGQSVPVERRDAFVNVWTAVSEQANEALLQKHQTTLVGELLDVSTPDKDSGLRIESSRTLVRVMGGAE